MHHEDTHISGQKPEEQEVRVQLGPEKKKFIYKLIIILEPHSLCHTCYLVLQSCLMIVKDMNEKVALNIGQIGLPCKTHIIQVSCF